MRIVLLCVAILPWLLLISGSSVWSLLGGDVSLGASKLSASSAFEWRQLRDVLRWWEGRRELALSLETWPEPEGDVDECLTRYQDAKHNEICVISS
ncbi:hypothetical protein F441_15531 [Phytophthora nicotianae CJ01A1]|uniref:RxLR effector protein n=5 Tax=Phytophthora nicotianae TaxID=4792 RepID=V9EJD9_PHYNI|nr:hypothetical protein F443_15712 [Phytophthora nicotianae P1569]ETK78838.1 hypothetical protein L915_15253 [Phytophthora nicotianae]ETO67393.1 hypothetical protein F444_15690 [Phytophthora nicotianae P1976]ETP08546.1 hypothetical protein F441_15531 [Phytophthora nicotianae CJ01A1]ETP36838.1 hypothetical protein F442_15287 [Phytophthora nicotianae P10297]